MGRLERGTDLVRALRRVCADHSVRTAEIRALGALESVEICAYEQKNRTYGPARTFKGDLEILSLTGNVSEKQGELALHLHITLARDTDNGIQVLGGNGYMKDYGQEKRYRDARQVQALLGAAPMKKIDLVRSLAGLD